MAINFSDLIASQRGNSIDPERFRLKVPRSGVRLNAVSSGETKNMEIQILHYLDFQEIVGIVADFVVTFSQPLPSTRLETVELCQRWIVEHGRFKGLDYDKVNKHTLYAAKIRIAKLFSDLFQQSRVPASVLKKPADYDPAKCQFKREIVKQGCQFPKSPSEPLNAAGQRGTCSHLEDFICTMTDGTTKRYCNGHYRWQSRHNLVESATPLKVGKYRGKEYPAVKDDAE